MIIKPVKQMGNGFNAKIYKHFVAKEKTGMINDEEDSYYISIAINGTNYGVYQITNESPYVIKLGYAEGLVQINNHNVTVVNALNSVCYITKEDEEKVYIRLKKVVQGQSISDNYSVFDITEGSYKGTILSEMYTELGEYETNKFYYMGEFAYTPIDDINESNAQFLKGAFIKQETRSIRWDIDNVPLQEDDIVILEGGAYLVGSVNVVFKTRLAYFKSYVATLTKLA